MKLLLDEMWPGSVAEQLRQRGHDVVAVVERPDLRGQPDDVVFATAQVEGRAVVTENVSDFLRLAAGASHHAGLVLTSNRRFPRGDARTIGRLVAALEALLSAQEPIAPFEYWLG